MITSPLHFNAGSPDAPYMVCAGCGHQLTVDRSQDRCENCHADGSWLDYYEDQDDADDASERALARLGRAA